jgi:hypothetical protein
MLDIRIDLGVRALPVALPNFTKQAVQEAKAILKK